MSGSPSYRSGRNAHYRGVSIRRAQGACRLASDPAGRWSGDRLPAPGGGHRGRAAYRPRDRATAAAVLGCSTYADHGLPPRDAGRRDARDPPRVPLRFRGRIRHQLAGPRSLLALGCRTGRGPVPDGRGCRLDRETLWPVSHRIITVLEGEGLFNDATSLVLLSAAMSAGLAADEHALNPGILIGKVALALGIAAVIGWGVGEVGVRVRALIKEPSADTVFSFVMPFIASIPAEHLGGSGLVAAVVAGLVVSRRRAAVISASNRRFSQQNWQTMTLVLESRGFS